MIKFEITYNGKRYDDLIDATEQALLDAIIEGAKKTIKPFEQEIASEGGTVSFHVSGKILSGKPDIQMKISEISTDLHDRIMKSLE